MRRNILALWIVFSLISLGIGALFFDAWRESERGRVQRGHSQLRAACEAIRSRYVEGFVQVQEDPRLPERPPHDREPRLDALVGRALAEFAGVEGGLWDERRGFFAYAFPSHGGPRPKTDVPQVESPQIAALARDATSAGALHASDLRNPRETVLIAACPLPGPPAGVSAWTLMRTPANGPGAASVLAALGGLLIFAFGAGLWLSITLGRWSLRLQRVERELAQTDASELRALAPTGDAELDRIVSAFNALGARLALSRRESDRLLEKMAQADRLASLGRLSAGLAHEIRNPLAAMRLKIENALASEVVSREPPVNALAFTLGQVERLERLVRDLLTMTQRLELNPRPVEVRGWLTERIATLELEASRREVDIEVECSVERACFDAFHLGRALENLILNALQHAPARSRVRVEALARGSSLCLRVSDAGPGVMPELRKKLFEPFATGRVDGTGLGLAIVKEIAAAHGGEVRELSPAQGACFEIEGPWLAC